MSSPFGIALYSQLQDLTILNDFGQHRHAVLAPSPHPLFTTYVVQTNAAGEIVWIKGVSDLISNDGFGVSIRALVDRVAEQLVQRYGRGAKTDFLHPGAMWEDPQHWMHALEANERGYFHLWQRPATARSLPDDLESIYVGASALDAFTSNAVLEYASSRLADAQAHSEQDMANYL